MMKRKLKAPCFPSKISFLGQVGNEVNVLLMQIVSAKISRAQP